MTVSRRLATAEVLSIGTELLVGETRDTNSGDIARALDERGVAVLRVQALRDDLDSVSAAFTEARSRADLVISTGGLGPTPDDLTREAIAACLSETPGVDPDLERWLEALWQRRGLPFPEINRKQAWLIPSAITIPNDHGTAPGWWVERPGESIVVALPGPPREMEPMWTGWVLPRLSEVGLGVPRDVRTLRLSAIGESQVADRLGEALLRSANPSVATYARADAVDVRISAVDETPPGSADPGASALTAAQLADQAEIEVLRAVGDHVWARGRTTWPEALEAELERHSWSVAIVEVGTGGAVTALLGGIPQLSHAELRDRLGTASARAGRGLASRAIVERTARELAALDGVDVGLAVAVRERRGDTVVTVAVTTPEGSHSERRMAFLGGSQGRSRAALSAADVLLRTLRRGTSSGQRRA